MQKIIKIFSFLLVAVSLTGCLKSDPNGMYEQGNSLTPYASIALSHLYNSGDSTTSYSLEILDNPNAYLDTSIQVFLGSNTSISNVNFKMAVAKDDPVFLNMLNNNKSAFDIYYDNDGDLTGRADSAYIENYVNSFDELTLMPENLYSIENFNVPIKNVGPENVGYLPIKFKTGAVDSDGNTLFSINNYVLPIKIEDAGGYKIASNYRMIFLVVKGKNAYDGKYLYTTSAKTSLRPNSTANVQLITAGAHRVKLSPGLLGYYSNDVYYNIDPATNHITVECPSLGVQSPQDPRSKYDPATKTLKVYWKQGNGGRTFEETLVFTGPR